MLAVYHARRRPRRFESYLRAASDPSRLGRSHSHGASSTATSQPRPHPRRLTARMRSQPWMCELVSRLAAAFELATPFLRFVASDRRRTHLASPGRRRLDAVVRDQIRLAFADELAPLPADTVDILAAVLSVDAWGHMRTIQGHSAERAAALMEVALVRLLGVESPSRR